MKKIFDRWEILVSAVGVIIFLTRLDARLTVVEHKIDVIGQKVGVYAENEKTNCVRSVAVVINTPVPDSSRVQRF